MKIVVFSDSHGNVTNMKKVVEKERPDHIFHAGDVARDADALRSAFPDIPLEGVCGNCDHDSDMPAQLIADVQGRRVMLCHGHLYHVKLGMGAAVAAARKAKVDALVFGHTHEALCMESEGLWILNPGSIRDGWRPSYGVMELSQDGITCHITELQREGESHAFSH